MNKDFQHFVGFNVNNIKEHFESKFNQNYMEHMYCGKLIKCGYDKQPKTSEDGVSFYFRECAKNPEEYDYQILKDEHADITNTIKCLNRKINNPTTCEKDKVCIRHTIKDHNVPLDLLWQQREINKYIDILTKWVEERRLHFEADEC